MPTRYKGKTVAFLTQHGKESLIGPMLEAALGCQIVRAQGFDTDQLGTFSGEITRLNNQQQTARQKARIGMTLAQTSIGLASEGSFMADPFGGLMPWNIETLAWIDDDNKIEIFGIAQGPTRNLQRSIRNLSQLLLFANEAGFPEHHLVLRPEHPFDSRIHKGIADQETLITTFNECLSASKNQEVIVENDLRAFSNPTRQAMIRLAANDLLQKIQSLCPQCQIPGFSSTQHHPGLICRQCARPTRLTRSTTWQCSSCGYTLEKPSPHRWANPNRCDYCNP